VYQSLFYTEKKMSSEQTSKFIHNFKKGDIVHFHARTL